MLPDKGTVLSIDIETVGSPAPLYSMKSLAVAAFSPFSPAETSYIDSFSENLNELPWAGRDPVTMQEFWQPRPEEWEVANRNRKDPATVMALFAKWLRKKPKPWTLVAWPCSYDFPALLYYQTRFLGTPLITNCLDMKTLASDRLQIPYNQVRTSKLPRWLLEMEVELTTKALGGNTPHVALDDAVRQGYRYMLLEHRFVHEHWRWRNQAPSVDTHRRRDED